MPETKKRKKKYYMVANKKQRTGEVFRPGRQGFLITCANVHDRKNTVMEAYRILNEYADKKYGPENIVQNNNDDDEDEDENIEDALKKEISDIKCSNAKGAERRFQNVPTKSKNTIFINANIEDPTSLVNDIFQDLISSQIKKTRTCLRFLPVMYTCYAKTEDIIKCAKKCIEPVFVNQNEFAIHRFCIVWKTRCNNSIKRDDVLPPLVDYIFSEVEHITDYNTPEIVVNIDVVGPICCIGLLKNFMEFKKYNIDLVVQIGGEEKKKDEEYDEKEIYESKEDGDEDVEGRPSTVVPEKLEQSNGVPVIEDIPSIKAEVLSSDPVIEDIPSIKEEVLSSDPVIEDIPSIKEEVLSSDPIIEDIPTIKQEL